MGKMPHALKNCWDIVSGKRYRTNTLTSAASDDALRRYGELALGKPEKAVQMALITVAPDVAAKIVGDLPRGLAPNKDGLANLAGYLAWRLPEMACGAFPNPLLPDPTGQLRKEMHRLGVMVYPATGQVELAITRYQSNQAAFSASPSALGQYTYERWNIVNSLLGVQAVESMFKNVAEIIKYGWAIDRDFEYGEKYFAEWYSYLRDNPNSLR